MEEILNSLKTSLGSPPAIGEYNSQLERWVREYLAAGKPITELLVLPFVWQAPICECLCAVGDYAMAALGIRVKLRCQASEVWIETGKKVIPAPLRTQADGAWTKGRGIGRTLHLSTRLTDGDEVELDAFYALAALRQHCSAAWHEAVRTQSSSVPQTDRIVEVSYTVAGGAAPTITKSKKVKAG